MLNLIKKLFSNKPKCEHDYRFEKNLYGKNIKRGYRSIWVCNKCGKKMYSYTLYLPLKNNNNNTTMKTQDKIEFSYNATTKEQFLKFKNYMKESAAKGPGHVAHYESVAYYMFKHRIGADPENEYLVDTVKLEEYLDEAVKNCYKCLYNGQYTYSCGMGGYWTEKSAVPGFKNKVRETYNKFASYDSKGTN